MIIPIFVIIVLFSIVITITTTTTTTIPITISIVICILTTIIVYTHTHTQTQTPFNSIFWDYEHPQVFDPSPNRNPKKVDGRISHFSQPLCVLTLQYDPLLENISVQIPNWMICQRDHPVPSL